MEGTTFFWTDRWMHGSCLEYLPPNCRPLCTSENQKKENSVEALHGNSWAVDIKGALGWFCLVEYLELWDMLAGVTWMTQTIHRWKPEALGLISTRSAYKIFFPAPFPLNLGRKCGRLGRQINAKHLCGWPFGTIVRLQIVCKKEAYHILSTALWQNRLN